MTTTVANSVSKMESYPRLVVTTGEIIGRRGAAVTWLKKNDPFNTDMKIGNAKS